MLYRCKKKIPFTEKINKCEYKLTVINYCISSATKIHDDKYICDYHYNKFIKKELLCEGCYLNINMCLCKKEIKYINILSSDEEYESEDTDNEEITKDPDKKEIPN
jgi:hypothetical protein